MVIAFYNDNDGFVCQWTRNLIEANLITKGVVDERPIQEIRAKDLEGFTRAHFFSGICGWDLALQLAGWPEDRPVWTGSCPCQPFSQAGKGKGFSDERHLWPVFRDLIGECRPSVVFGEQIASPLGHLWLDGVRLDVEAMGYRFGAADLCAASVGAPHIRSRLFWVAAADSNGGRRERVRGNKRTWSNVQFEELVRDALRASLPAGTRGFVADGVRHRSPKLRAYGNSIVPQIAAEFIKAFMDTDG